MANSGNSSSGGKSGGGKDKTKKDIYFKYEAAPF